MFHKIEIQLNDPVTELRIWESGLGSGVLTLQIQGLHAPKQQRLMLLHEFHKLFSLSDLFGDNQNLMYNINI